MRRLALIAGALALIPACTTDNRTTAPTTPTAPSVTTTVAPTIAPSTAAPTTTEAPTTAAAPATTAPPTTAAPTTAAPTTTEAPTTTTTIPPGHVLALGAGGIGAAGFGADPDGVVDYLRSILGAPTVDSDWVDPSALGACTGTVARAVAWHDLTLYFGDEAPSFGGRRHFFGYTYGPPFAAAIDPPGPAADGGITVGSTVGELRSVYPSAGVNPAEGDAPANFTIVEGLSGYLSGTSDDDTITELIGGQACAQ